jgi:hypothetical protein
MVREPIFKSTPLAELRPTQITVGMREVEAKRRHWRAKHGDKAGAFLASHMIPVVLGPGEHPYVIDHHHLARALHEEGHHGGGEFDPAREGRILDLSRQPRLDAPVRR